MGWGWHEDFFFRLGATNQINKANFLNYNSILHVRRKKNPDTQTDLSVYVLLLSARIVWKLN